MRSESASLLDRLHKMLPELAADTSPRGRDFFETASAYIRLVERFDKVMGIADKYQEDVRATKEELLLSRNEIERQHEELKSISSQIQQREQDLRQSEEKYRLLAEHSTDVIWTINLDGHFTYVSPSVLQLRGYTPEEVLQQSIEEAVCPGSFPLVWEILRNDLSSIRSGEQIGTRYVKVEQPRKDGSTVWTEVSAQILCNDAGDPTGILGVSRDISMRKNMEDALQESEQILQLFTDNASDVLYITDLTANRLIFISASIERQTGFTMEEAMTNRLDQIMAPASYAYIIPRLAERSRLFLQGVGGSHEYTDEIEYYRKDGSSYIAELTTRYTRNKEGLPIIVGILRDITKRKQMEIALQESEKHFRSLFENAPIGIFHSVLEGRFLAVNPALTSILGYSSPEDLIAATTDMNTQIYEDPAIRPQIMQALLANDGWVHQDEVLWRKKDGRVISVDMTGRKVLNAQGEIAYLEGFIIDITRRKQIEQELKENEEKFISIFEETPDPILILNPAYQILEVNRGFEKVFGCLNSKIIGKKPEELGIGLTCASINQLFAQANPLDATLKGEVNLVNGSGLPFIAEISISRIIIHAESCLLIQIHDIDAIRRAHDAVAQVNNKLKILSSITRHDILNRIMVTSFYSEELRSAITDPTLQKQAESIRIASDQIRALIEFTGQYQDLGVVAPDWQHVGTILKQREIQGILGGVLMSTDIGSLQIYADMMLTKVMYNLVENSVRHGKNLSTISITSHEEGGDLIIWYEDDGGGILDEEKEKVFEKGFGKNTGLGLFLIREILSITGITIREIGSPGVGVRFEIRVPAGKFRIPV